MPTHATIMQKKKITANIYFKVETYPRNAIKDLIQNPI